MKNRKLNILWIAGPAALVILILLLTMCTGPREETPETIPTETVPQLVQAPTEQTLLPAETTAPTEETTEPTEETTEPTEETTEPTTSGSSGSGSSGSGSSGGSSGTTEPTEPPLVVPDPGTEKNPYLEVVSEYPGTVTTVNIPGKSGISYLISGSAGNVITIAQPDIKVTCGGKTYRSDDNGVVTVDMSGMATDAVISITNASEEETACELQITVPLGAKTNPAPVSDITAIPVALKAGDTNGYHYLWTAPAAGRLELSEKKENQENDLTEKTPEIELVEKAESEELVLSVNTGTEKRLTVEERDSRKDSLLTQLAEAVKEFLAEEPEKPSVEIIVTAGQVPSSLSESEGVVAVEVEKLQEVLIQVIAVPEADGSYPEVKTELTGVFTPKPGTQENPLVISDTSVPTAVMLYSEETFYLNGPFHGQILTIWEAADVSVTYGDQTIQPDEFGTIALTFPEAEEAGPEPIALALTSSTDKEYTLVFSYPLGTEQNPDTMIVGENQAVLEENDADGYTFLWYADMEGELTISMPEDIHWQYALNGVIHTSAEEPRPSTNRIPVTVGQEVLFTVNTFDPTLPDGTPAGTVAFTVSFYDPTLGTESNPIYLELEDTITIPAGQTIYYTARVDGMIMTLTGENVKLTHNGVAYIPANGVIELTCSGSGMMQPPVFAITNTGTEEASCSVVFAYPLGHQENPAQLALGQTGITLEAGDEDGYSFRWTAQESGSFTITMTEGTAWQYVVNNLTSFVSGELHTSSDDPVVITETVQVNAGDELRILVNTYDPENPFAIPGGEILFQTAFVPDAQ